MGKVGSAITNTMQLHWPPNRRGGRGRCRVRVPISSDLGLKVRHLLVRCRFDGSSAEAETTYPWPIQIAADASTSMKYRPISMVYVSISSECRSEGIAAACPRNDARK